MSSSSFTRAIIAGVACTATIAAIGVFSAGAAFADPTGATTTITSSTTGGKTTSTADATAPTADYVAVGSDTIQSLYDGFANGYTDGSATKPAVSEASIASWLATGTTGSNGVSLITPSNAAVPSGANPIGRPANSGDGRAALSAAWDPASDAYTQSVAGTPTTYTVTPHSIDIARSSGKPSGTAGVNDLTSIPLARDAVSVAINGEPTLDDVITAGTLAAVYGAPDNTNNSVNGSDFAGGNYTQVAGSTTAGDVRNTGSTTTPNEEIYDGTTWITVHPYLPYNSGSGTRQFFLQAIGSSKTATPGDGVDLGNGITTTDSNGNPIIENTGALVAQQGDIAPFSAAQWIAQQNGIATNTVTDSAIQIAEIGGKTAVTGTPGTLVPGTLYGDTTQPAASGFGVFDRDVYSVVASAELEKDSTLKDLVSNTLPNSPAVSDFGFDPIPSVSAQSANWIESGWENVTATGGTPATQTTTTSVAVSDISAQTVTLKATITAPTGFAVPVGDTVTFKNGSTTVATGTTNAAGVATATFTASTGSQTFNFTASYAGHSTDDPAPFAASASPALSYAAVIVPQDTLSSVKISGTARVGGTLSASVAGAVSGSSYYYTWRTGTATLSHSSSFVIPAAEYKKTITLQVTSEKAGYINSAAKTSSATATVAAGVLTAPTPKISGTTTEGKTLTAETGTWTSGTTLHYQWKANGASISGATAHTFKLTSSQVGKKITVTVTGTKTDYTSAAKTSASTKAVVK